MAEAFAANRTLWKGMTLMKFGRIALLLFVLVMTAVFVLPIRADEGVQISLIADKSELTVGEPVRLRLEVTHPAGYQVIIPKLEQVWSGRCQRRWDRDHEPSPGGGAV
jgi:hypothetical protein